MIPIGNIYYMLSYAFRVLNEDGYKDFALEDFENSMDLSAAILIKGVSREIKRGLHRDYISKSEALSGIKGKIDISESIKTMAIYKKQLVCSYEEFTENSYLNRILKTTMELLLSADIDRSRKKEIRKLLVYFGQVDSLDPYRINWSLNYHRNNRSYEMLIAISYMVIQGLLQSSGEGKARLMNFTEKHMHRLYERFLLEYYKKEHPELKVAAPHISWQVDDESSQWLPLMNTDLVLSKEDKHLIIDAKYYTKVMQYNYSTAKVRSSHLYQIFAYIKNKEAKLGQEAKVAGMLLYAGTDEEHQPENSYSILGNRIDVRTLDLSGDFGIIRDMLDWIVEDIFLDS